MNNQVLHIAIDVSFTDDQIQGQVGDGVGAPTAFTGWIGLISQLDEMLGTASTPVVGHGDRTHARRSSDASKDL
jgi:hypothetical protein